MYNIGIKYAYIVNPKTGRKVKTNGKLGRKILNMYVTYLSGGAEPMEREAALQSSARGQAWALSGSEARWLSDAGRRSLAGPIRPHRIDDLQARFNALRGDGVNASSAQSSLPGPTVSQAAAESDVNRLMRLHALGNFTPSPATNAASKQSSLPTSTVSQAARNRFALARLGHTRPLFAWTPAQEAAMLNLELTRASGEDETRAATTLPDGNPIYLGRRLGWGVNPNADEPLPEAADVPSRVLGPCEDDTLRTLEGLAVTVAKMQWKMAQDGAAMTMSDVCAICHESWAETEDEAKVVKLPNCGHIFHIKCITTWGKQHCICPYRCGPMQS